MNLHPEVGAGWARLHPASPLTPAETPGLPPACAAPSSPSRQPYPPSPAPSIFLGQEDALAAPSSLPAPVLPPFILLSFPRLFGHLLLGLFLPPLVLLRVLPHSCCSVFFFLLLPPNPHFTIPSLFILSWLSCPLFTSFIFSSLGLIQGNEAGLPWGSEDVGGVGG